MQRRYSFSCTVCNLSSPRAALIYYRYILYTRFGSCQEVWWQKFLCNRWQNGCVGGTKSLYPLSYGSSNQNTVVKTWMPFGHAVPFSVCKNSLFHFSPLSLSSPSLFPHQTAASTDDALKERLCGLHTKQQKAAFKASGWRSREGYQRGCWICIYCINDLFSNHEQPHRSFSWGLFVHSWAAAPLAPQTRLFISVVSVHMQSKHAWLCSVRNMTYGLLLQRVTNSDYNFTYCLCNVHWNHTVQQLRKPLACKVWSVAWSLACMWD